MTTACSSDSDGSIQTSPSITPSFNKSIHDYVIDCTTSSQIQFMASRFGSGVAVAGPGEAMSPSASGPDYQRTLNLAPGQRFQFTIGQSGSSYSVRCLPQDFPPLNAVLPAASQPQWSSPSLTATVNGVPEAQWYLFAPTLIKGKYVILTDSRGTPVWWKSEPSGLALDAKVLGPNQIAWTVLTGYGVDGEYVIRDFSGQTLNTLVGNLDDHELQPTPSGTFLAIRDVQRICPPDCADMSPWGGSAQLGVVDAEIIEIDKNSNVVWTWRTRDHIGLGESGAAGWFPGVGIDIIHMNAVEPDGTDGVLFSARHLNAIYHITKSTGNIDWKIGGTPRPESLTVIGDVRPSAIGPGGLPLNGQHDVRKWPDGTVSVHDNGTSANRPPTIVRYQVDPLARTATVVEELSDPRYQHSMCCGSARRLPKGHWLVQWGAAPFFTELDSFGNPVLTVQYNQGDVFSYRAVPVLPGVVSADTLRDGMDAMSAD